MYDPSKLPLVSSTTSDSFKVERPIFMHSVNDENFIEGCEWVYKCPLKFEDLEYKNANSRFCKECSKTVYHVDNAEDFTKKISEDKCVEYEVKVERNIVIRMGRKCF